jgi:hypothetical protein
MSDFRGNYDALNNEPALTNNDPNYISGNYVIAKVAGSNNPIGSMVYIDNKLRYFQGIWSNQGLDSTTDTLTVSYDYDQYNNINLPVMSNDNLTLALKKLQNQVNIKNNIRPIVSIIRNYYQITVDQFKAQTVFLVSAPNLTILMPDPTLITPNGYQITIKNLNITNTQIIAVTGLMDNESNYSLMAPYISRNFMIYNGNFLLT